jgi:hypothetical protein
LRSLRSIRKANSSLRKQRLWRRTGDRSCCVYTSSLVNWYSRCTNKLFLGNHHCLQLTWFEKTLLTQVWGRKCCCFSLSCNHIHWICMPMCLTFICTVVLAGGSTCGALCLLDIM